ESCAEPARTSRALQPSSSSPAEREARRSLTLSGARLQIAVDEFLEVRLGHGAQHAVGHLTALEQDERRNARHLVLEGRLLVLVDVELGEADLAVQLLRQLV